MNKCDKCIMSNCCEEFIECGCDKIREYAKAIEDRVKTEFGASILILCTELEIENDCIDHTENEDGEWVTMTIDYNKWAELFWFIEHGKTLETWEQEHEHE